jgi:hypothetical protein
MKFTPKLNATPNQAETSIHAEQYYNPGTQTIKFIPFNKMFELVNSTEQADDKPMDLSRVETKWSLIVSKDQENKAFFGTRSPNLQQNIETRVFVSEVITCQDIFRILSAPHSGAAAKEVVSRYIEGGDATEVFAILDYIIHLASEELFGPRKGIKFPPEFVKNVPNLARLVNFARMAYLYAHL